MADSLTTIGLQLESAIQAEMVAELGLALIERKQSCRFRHKSIICKKATKRVRKCAKVKGRVELKIDKDRYSYDFPKLHHSNSTVPVLTSTYTQFIKNG